MRDSPRASGIVLHLTSLPGRFGIGDLGDAAYRFVDFLAASGQQLWQIMPLGPTGYGDSPYSALSAFAGNSLLISLEKLVDQHYVAEEELADAPPFPEETVAYGQVIGYKQRLLRRSYDNFRSTAGVAECDELRRFEADNREWLDDYALYAALKERHDGAAWIDWEADIATRQPEAVARWRTTLCEAVAYHRYVQWQFFKQWLTLKGYANRKGICIIGDIPIFVAYDSADAWAHPELFFLDQAGRPTVVAGVPPDYFSPTGQLWGNPLYRWDRMASTDFAWWVERMRITLGWVDIVRLDHFRGFESYWAVPSAEKTAVNGKWVKGPGAELFRALERRLGVLPIIVEDLGMIDARVRALRDELGLPGMAVLQFAFAGGPDNLYLPHNLVRNSVVYTGTHDNDTTRGWFTHASPQEVSAVQKYLGRHGDDINWDLIRSALMSVADRALFPLQDVLGQGSQARMNTPGQAGGNWSWRYRESMLTDEISERLKELTQIYGRLPRVEEPEVDIPADAG